MILMQEIIPQKRVHARCALRELKSRQHKKINFLTKLGGEEFGNYLENLGSFLIWRLCGIDSVGSAEYL